MRYRAIDELKDSYNITSLCKIAKVSRSGYYKWKNPKVKFSKRERK